MIDLHCRILPGVDDGPESMDEAIEMCKVAIADGTRTVVAVPHHLNGLYYNEVPRILEEVERSRGALKEEGLDIEIVPGADIHIHPRLLDMIRKREAMTINDNGHVVMLEFPYYFPPEVMVRFICALSDEGIIGVISHPERCTQFEQDGVPEELIDAGAVAQVTAFSLIGGFGRGIQRLARKMIKKGLIHVIASDAHSPGGRPPMLSDAVGEAANLVGEEKALRMVSSHPKALIEGARPN